MNRMIFNILKFNYLAGLSIILFICLNNQVFSQVKCLTNEEAKNVLLSIQQSQNVSLNKKLRDELVKLQMARQKVNQNIIDYSEDNQKYISEAEVLGEKHLLRLCEVVRENGWPSKEMVGEEGLSAVVFLLENSKSAALQREILPVVTAAARKGLIVNRPLAYLIDSIRIANGQLQIFGTQAELKDELYYLYPIQSEKNLDALRKTYGLPSISDYYLFAQRQWQMPVIKIPRPALSANSKKSDLLHLPGNLNEKDDEIVKVESSAVNLNVRILDVGLIINSGYKKEDFTVYDNGKEQEINYFSFQEQPIDLILMVDLRGWTREKKELSVDFAQRFAKAVKPSDRIASFSSTGKQRNVTSFTQNRDDLFKQEEVTSSENGWVPWSDLEFVLDNLVDRKSKNRRSVIIWITNGADGNLHYRANPNHSLDHLTNTFTELLEKVRNSETTILPIYIDTENDELQHIKNNADLRAFESPDPEVLRRAATYREMLPWIIKKFRQAKRTLKMIADESGGQVYYAKKAEELDGVYEQIINDLGKIYTLGYEPDGKRDGSWHKVEVKLKDQPNVNLRTKKGYYSR